MNTIAVVVGSTNQVKADAAFKAVKKCHPKHTIKVICVEADHGITDWKSKYAIGQPFELEQTRFGAVNRMNSCWKKAKNDLQDQFSKVYFVGIENGLVSQDHESWFDTCFVSVCEIANPSVKAVRQGESVLTEFGLKGNSFDEKVQEYHKIIMPKIHQGTDLYIEWTKDFPEGPQTRAYFIQECLMSCLEELENSSI